MAEQVTEFLWGNGKKGEKAKPQLPRPLPSSLSPLPTSFRSSLRTPATREKSSLLPRVLWTSSLLSLILIHDS